MEIDEQKVYLISVSLRVLAFSQVFRLRHPTFFIRGESSRTINIVARNTKSHEWIKSLEIGSTYTFTKLIPSLLWKGTTDETKLLEATSGSEAKKIQVNPQKPFNDSYSEAASYVGKVSGVGLSQFGLIEIEDDSVLCTTFVMQYAFLPHFQPKDEISLFNTHSKIVNGKTYIVMCGLSRLLSQNESREENPKHAVVDFCITNNFGIEDFLKVVFLFIKLKKLLESFTSSSYSRDLSEHVPEVLGSFYPEIQDKKGGASSKDAYKEFLISPHQCRPMKEGYLEKLELLSPDEFLSFNAPWEDGSALWTHKLFPRMGGANGGDHNVAVVGKLEVDLKTGHLLLRGGCKINCVIPEDKHLKSEIEQCVGRLVVVKGASQVVERFMIPSRYKEQLEERLFNYILLSPGNIHLIFKDTGAEDVAQKGLVNDLSVSVRESRISADESMDVDDDHLSQRFVLHHASSPLILESKVMFFALVSLLGSAGVSCSQESDSFSRWRMLCMQGTMVQHFPFLSENRVYEIRYPKSYGVHYFDKSSNVPELNAAKKILPNVRNGVLIPHDSSLHGPFESPHLPEDSVVKKEIYGVNDALLLAPVNDVVHVQGVLLNRSHQTPKYQVYVSNSGIECGIPGEKNIVLKLQDINNNMEINIYIIKWATKQYPLGLLPGATICIKFAEKRRSARGNFFFQSTCLTSIKVVEYSAECYSRISCPSKIKRSYLKQESAQSFKSPFWTILSVYRVWLVEIAPVCDKCGSAVIYGSFECRSCARHVNEPAISCKANISVGDGTGLAYLRVKDDHIRYFLDLEEKEWEELKDLSKKKRLLYIREKQSPSESLNSKLDADQIAFQFFCEEVVPSKLWKVVCRKFAGQGEGDIMKLFCLDVEAVDFDLAQSLVKSDASNI